MHVEIMGRPPGCKLIRLSADIEDGLVMSLSVRGDFFASPETGFDNAVRRMAGIALDQAACSFNSFLKDEGVEAFGINGEAIAELLYQAINSELENS
jgi:hypothetical protein